MIQQLTFWHSLSISKKASCKHSRKWKFIYQPPSLPAGRQLLEIKFETQFRKLCHRDLSPYNATSQNLCVWRLNLDKSIALNKNKDLTWLYNKLFTVNYITLESEFGGVAGVLVLFVWHYTVPTRAIYEIHMCDWQH